MRSIWKGSISFGLINIPVRLYSAIAHEHELKFKLLHNKDLSEIRYARICKADEKEVPWKDIVKGYQTDNGRVVVMTDKDFEKADVTKSKTIEILDFTNVSEIDTIYYHTPYYLEPEKGAVKAYNLLREALKKSKKVAVAKFVMRNHEHLVLIKPYEHLLLLNQLRYSEELINPSEIKIGKEQAIPKKEMDMAVKLIDQLTEKFNPDSYTDTYIDELRDIIEKKGKGQKIKETKEVKKSPKIHDIVSLLKESLEQKKKKKTRKVS
jgi:DNA end-binding protein Ku